MDKTDHSTRPGFLGRLDRLGNVLRLAFRVIVPQPTHTAPPEIRSERLDHAVDRATKAADSLQIISTLAMNPANPGALDAGIKLALERLSDGVNNG